MKTVNKRITPWLIVAVMFGYTGMANGGDTPAAAGAEKKIQTWLLPMANLNKVSFSEEEKAAYKRLVAEYKRDMAAYKVSVKRAAADKEKVLKIERAAGHISETSTLEGTAYDIIQPQMAKPIQPDPRKWGTRRWIGENAWTQKRLVIVGFLSSENDFSKKEAVELSRLHKLYKDQGVGSLIVYSYKKDKKDKMKDWLTVNTINAPVLNDRFRVLTNRTYKIKSLPHILLIDSSGNIQQTESTVDGLESKIKSFLTGTKTHKDGEKVK